MGTTEAPADFQPWPERTLSVRARLAEAGPGPGYARQGRPGRCRLVRVKMPRAECSCCHRHIAAGMVAGSPGKGRLWRHDPPDRRARYGDSLVSCPGSLAVVDLPRPALQLELVAVSVAEGVDGIDLLPLF